MESKKIQYTMGELAEMFDVNVSLIRHWSNEFDIIKPARNKKGNRLFSPSDVENFKLIYHLVKERGMTLEGARQSLRRGSIVTGSSLERDTMIMERLQSLRSTLIEIKTMLKEVDEAADQNPSGEFAVSLRGRGDSTSEPDAESRELFAFYEQRLF
ncbi:MAG: MerR family transcriptional regulator [Rikenellaceae bacterium]